jgi:hypothetical protein
MIKKFKLCLHFLSLSLLSFKIKQKTRFIQESSKKPVPPLSLTGKSLYFRRKKSPFFSWTSSRWIPSHFSPEKGLHFRQALSLTFRRKKPLFSSEKVSILARKNSLFSSWTPSHFSPERGLHFRRALSLTFRWKRSQFLLENLSFAGTAHLSPEKLTLFAGNLSLFAGKALPLSRRIYHAPPEKLLSPVRCLGN